MTRARTQHKVTWETRKIMDLPDLPVSCTCVRIPTLRAHAESITIETEKPIVSGERARGRTGAGLRLHPRSARGGGGVVLIATPCRQSLSPPPLHSPAPLRLLLWADRLTSSPHLCTPSAPSPPATPHPLRPARLLPQDIARAFEVLGNSPGQSHELNAPPLA